MTKDLGGSGHQDKTLWQTLIIYTHEANRKQVEAIRKDKKAGDT